MNFNPKAPQVYKPVLQRVSTPPVYQRQQITNPGVQPKATSIFRLETRPAPPVYCPNQGNTPSAQLKPAHNFRVETRPAPPVYQPQSRGISAAEQKPRPAPIQPQSLRSRNAGFASRGKAEISALNASQRLQIFRGQKEPSDSQLKKKIYIPSVTQSVQPPKKVEIDSAVQRKSKAYELPKHERPIELGGALNGRLFLFQGSLGRTTLRIKAHGHVDRSKKFIKVPEGITLRCYSLHGDVVYDPGPSLPGGEPIVYGEGEDVPNYVLSKFQGKHSEANETYQKIVNWVNEEGSDHDYLTVRNRFYSHEITLEEIFTAIQGRGYTVVDLIACRYDSQELSGEGLELRGIERQKLGYEEL